MLVTLQFLWSNSLFAQNQNWTESAQIDDLPYSSSFLPVISSQLSGGLFAGRPWGIKQPFETWYRLSPQVIWRSQTTPLIERFDKATSTFYQSPPILPLIKKHYSAPFYTALWQTPLWQGFCHRRTAASMDKIINRMAKAQQGLVCGDELFSQGEIKELFTAFTPYDQPSYRGQVSTKDTSFKLRNQTGFDDLSPLTFHQNLFKRLRNNQAVGLEVDASAAIDNQTVYGADSQFHSIDLKKVVDKKQTHLLPMKFLIGETKSAFELIQKLLQMQEILEIQAAQWRPEIKSAEKWDQWIHAPHRHAVLIKRGEQDYFYQYTESDRTITVSRSEIKKAFQKQIESEIQKNNEKLMQFVKENTKWLIDTAKTYLHLYRPQSFFQTRSDKSHYDLSDLYRKLDQYELGFFFHLIANNNLSRLIQKGEVRLNDKVRLVNVKTRVYHRKDTPFNTTEDEEGYLGSHTYNYLFAYYKNSVVHSGWQTRAQQRPDLLWWIAPIDIDYFRQLGRISDQESQTASYYGAFDNLMRLIEDCEPLEDYLLPPHFRSSPSPFDSTY